MRERPGRKSRGSFSGAQDSSRPPNDAEEEGSNVTFGKGALSRLKSHKSLIPDLAVEEDSESMRERPGRKSRGSFSGAQDSSRPPDERSEPRQLLAAAKGRARGAGADQARPSVDV